MIKGRVKRRKDIESLPGSLPKRPKRSEVEHVSNTSIQEEITPENLLKEAQKIYEDAVFELITRDDISCGVKAHKEIDVIIARLKKLEKKDDKAFKCLAEIVRYKKKLAEKCLGINF